jgi:hypothetical protein
MLDDAYDDMIILLISLGLLHIASKHVRRPREVDARNFFILFVSEETGKILLI